MKLNRRAFLVSGVAAAGFASLSIGQDKSKSEVFVGKGKAEEMIPKVLAKMGGMGRFVKPGSRVVIKPNMSFSNTPDWATTTSPEAVRAVVSLCIAAGAKRVIVADNTLHDPEMCKEKTGIAAAIKDFKAAVIYIPKQHQQYEEKTESRAKELTRVEVLKEVLKADTFISLPVAKAHGAGGVSLNIKGLMGLVWDPKVYHREMDLHIAIAEQLYYMKPHLSIVDAGRALLDNGPSGPGKVAELGTYVAGTDPVAVDSFSVTLAPWYGRTWEGKNIKHIRHAEALGFGNAESAMIKEIAV